MFCLVWRNLDQPCQVLQFVLRQFSFSLTFHWRWSLPNSWLSDIACNIHGDHLCKRESEWDISQPWLKVCTFIYISMSTDANLSPPIRRQSMSPFYFLSGVVIERVCHHRFCFFLFLFLVFIMNTIHIRFGGYEAMCTLLLSIDCFLGDALKLLTIKTVFRK